MLSCTANNSLSYHRALRNIGGKSNVLYSLYCLVIDIQASLSHCFNRISNMIAGIDHMFPEIQSLSSGDLMRMMRA